MTAAHRWWTVGVLVLLLLAAPVLVRALPVQDQEVSAATLLDRVRASQEVAFSGYAETAGRVVLPHTDALSSLGTLLGETHRLRVWWRDPSTWRVASLRTTGETDLVHSGDRMVHWVYESKRATVVPDVPVRLPTYADIVPNALAAYTLGGVHASEVSRLPARRVAGRDALGLRLTPDDARASVSRVDLYVDRTSAVPLEVQMFAGGSDRAFLTSRYLAFSTGRPAASVLSFDPPPDARLRYDDVVDLAAAADRFASRVPPTTLAGLPDREGAASALRGSVGVYGRGPTILLAIPLWSRTADRLREDLQRRAGVATVDAGLVLEADPLRLILAAPETNGTSWLLAGTVTRATLTDAAAELARNRPSLSGLP